ncbi:MAG: alpha/beta fold hydrolase, partial [Alphaproteobacteria bacterium]
MLAVAALGAPGLLGPELSARIESLPPGAPRLALAAAVFAETARRWGGFWSGVGKYCAHPYRRPSQARPVFWRAGDVAAIDFAPEGAGPTVIAVPSLVNTSDVLDLLPGRSLMQALADAGFRPLLVDWGQPPEDARSWPIARYVDERLSPLLSAVRQRDGAPPILMGYCMGGLLAAALAARRPDDVGALTLLATPWDFHAPSPEAGQAVAGMAAPFRQAAATSGAVPADLLQSLFFALDPTLAARKYRRFAEMDQAS